MIIYTDSPDRAERFLLRKKIRWERSSIPENDSIATLTDRIFGARDIFTFTISSEENWSYLLITKSAPKSQYDILIDLGRRSIPLLHGIICLAGEGHNFHGFKDRRWDSPEGNLYLCAHFAPKRQIENYGAGFMILAAVSVIDAIDQIPELSHKASIKWVNDILIDGAKVCGVLAHTIAKADMVTNAIIGIGLNVEITPDPEPTVFVPRAASLADFAPEPGLYNRGQLFELLIGSIYKNYLILIREGFSKLLARYRERSNIIGREVTIYEDSEDHYLAKIAEGRVKSIGDNLELYLEGRRKAIKRGRLAFN